MERCNTLQELPTQEPVEADSASASTQSEAAVPPLSLTDYGFNPLTQRYVLRRNAVWMRLIKAGKVQDPELAAEMRTLEEARALARRAAFAAPTGLSGIMQARAKQKRDAMTRTLAVFPRLSLVVGAEPATSAGEPPSRQGPQLPLFQLAGGTAAPPDARTASDERGLSLAERVAQDHADVLTALPRPDAKRVLAALVKAAVKSSHY